MSRYTYSKFWLYINQTQHLQRLLLGKTGSLYQGKCFGLQFARCGSQGKSALTNKHDATPVAVAPEAAGSTTKLYKCRNAKFGLQRLRLLHKPAFIDTHRDNVALERLATTQLNNGKSAKTENPAIL